MRAGDDSGLLVVYSASGGLVYQSGESLLKMVTDWDMDVVSPWRRILPNTIFPGFNGRVASRLYITTKRIVLIREIDPWRTTKGEMTPLGMPNATAKFVRLKELKAAGVREFCEVHPDALKVVWSRKSTKHGSWLGMRLISTDGRQYAMTFWVTHGSDDETLGLLQSRFRARRES